MGEWIYAGFGEGGTREELVDNLPDSRWALHLLVSGTALVFLPLPAGCVLSLLRLRSPIHPF